MPKKSLMKKIALRENRTANALPLCIVDTVDDATALAG